MSAATGVTITAVIVDVATAAVSDKTTAAAAAATTSTQAASTGAGPSVEESAVETTAVGVAACRRLWYLKKLKTCHTSVKRVT